MDANSLAGMVFGLGVSINRAKASAVNRSMPQMQDLEDKAARCANALVELLVKEETGDQMDRVIARAQRRSRVDFFARDVDLWPEVKRLAGRAAEL